MFFFFFFNDTATTEIYTLSLHDALPIYSLLPLACRPMSCLADSPLDRVLQNSRDRVVVLGCSEEYRIGLFDLLLERSEEHTSELQSLAYLVCRLLLEKKKKVWYVHSSTS